MGSMARERNEKNENNEHQTLSNLECVAKTIRNEYFCCFQCKSGLVNTQSKLI
jgi:hypothetical protein